MNRKNSANVHMLTNVLEFGKSNVSSFPKNSAASEILEALDSSIRELSERASARLSVENTMRESRNARISARNKLEGYLVRARLVSNAFGFDKVRSSADASDDALITCARAFIEAAGSVAKDFARHGVVLDDVGTAVEALETAVRGYAKAKSERAVIIKAAGKLLKEAKATLLRFDALAGSYLGDNAEAMAAYEIARTTPRVKARRAAVASTPAAVAGSV